jgi:hypothetical protein
MKYLSQNSLFLDRDLNPESTKYESLYWLTNLQLSVLQSTGTSVDCGLLGCDRTELWVYIILAYIFNPEDVGSKFSEMLIYKYKSTRR